jgi:hypothetical protein
MRPLPFPPGTGIITKAVGEGTIIPPPGKAVEKTWWVKLNKGNTAQCDYVMGYKE